MNSSALYIGVDVHERESQVAAFEKDGKLLQEKRVLTKKLPKSVSSLPSEEKHIGIESVGFIYPVYDALVKTGCDVAVANPNNVQLIARTKIKHDRVDSIVLGELLRTNFFPRSHMVDDETREKRLLVGDRARYGVKLANTKNSIKWLLKRRGIQVKKPLSLAGRNQIRSLGLREFEDRLREFEALESIVDELDKRISNAVSKDKRAQFVESIPGVGPFTALFLSSALDDVTRFSDSNHACAYVGLVPSLHQSGDLSYSGHITRQGNKWLRRNMIQCARWSIRKDPNIRQFYLRIARKRGKKKARVAVARKLVSYAYWTLKRNLTYEELNPWKTDSGSKSAHLD